MSEAPRSAFTGRRIGDYVVGPRLGAGGMGEVYRAHDTKLGRDVAIKILPADFTADPERLTRFEREARILARLNHPNIASIYGVHEAGDLRALVLELVEGETLADAIARGPLPLDRFLEAGEALADAIAAAHERGVTHRDLKPTNVMIRTDGRIKVLDFGIARFREDRSAAGAGTGTADTLTADGRILGTAAWMSPEQASGQPVDDRSDIFSLGAVLYVMATGQRPFGGDTALAQMAAVLTETPPAATRLRPDLPAGLDAIIGRALEKDPDRRYQSAQDLRNALEALRLAALREAAPDPLRRGLVWLAMLLGTVTVALATAVILGSRADPEPEVVSVTGARQLTFDEGIEATPAIAPDGRSIAWERDGDIYVMDLASGEPVNLTPDSPAFDGEPAFSPAGDRIAFSSRRDGGQVTGGIWLVDANGGPARRLTNSGFSPAWSPDGQEVLYATEFVRGEIRPTSRVRISALHAVRVQQAITRMISDGDVAQPAWSPNGHRIVFWRSFADGRPTRFTVMTMRPDGTDLVPVTSGEEFPLVWNPVWSPDGRHVYFCTIRDGTPGVWRVAVDERSGRPLGDPAPVPLPALMVRHIAFSANGETMAWEASRDEANVYAVPFDARAGVVRGPPVPVITGTRLWRAVDVSAGGRLVLSTELEPSELWVSASDGSGLERLLADPMHGRDGRWSPDGQRIAFTSAATGTMETWTAFGDGAELMQVSHFGADGAGFFPLWSADGTRLAVTTGVNFGGETFLVDPDRPWQEQTFEALRPAPGDPGLRYRPWSWSPDGRRIAAYSERGAGLAVYSLDSNAWEIITESGIMPRWLADSRRLVFADDGGLHVVDAVTKSRREIHAAPGVTLAAPAMAPGDTAIFYIRSRLERDIWTATVR